MKLQDLNKFFNDNDINTGINCIFYNFEQGNTSGFFVKNLINSGAEQYGDFGGNKFILQDYHPGFFVSCNDKNYQNTGMAYFEGYDNLKISKNITSDTFSLMLNIKSYGCNPDYIDIDIQNLIKPSGISWNNINFIRTGYNSGIKFIKSGVQINYVETNQIAKITGNDAGAADFFGYSVSLNSAGNVALIGAVFEDPNGVTNAGAAYIFTGSGNSWVQTAKITGNDAGVNDYFGFSVSLNSAGNVALIGAHLKDPNGVTNAGAAYIFTGSGNSWVQTAKITGNDAGVTDLFGISVSLNSLGNVALIGAYEEDPNEVAQAGSAYIFTGSGNSWVQTVKITGNDAGANDNFGQSVSLNSAGNVALIGALNEDPNGVTNAGCAYLFTGSGNSWVQTAKITGNDGQAGDNFGISVSLNSAGNVALIGANSEDPNGVSNAGSAYIFTGSGNSWVQTAKITGNDGQAGDNFGWRISLNSGGNVALIGAYQEDPNGVNGAGSAYIFTGSENSWVQTAKITGNDAQASDGFGNSVSLNSLGNLALIGAYQEDPNGLSNAGSAYIFDVLNKTSDINISFNKSGLISNFSDWTYTSGQYNNLIQTGIASKLIKTYSGRSIASNTPDFLIGKAQTILNLKSETNATNPFDLKVAITNNFKPIIEFSGNYSGNIVNFNKICVGELGNQSIVSLNGSRNNISVCYHDFLSNRNFCETINTTYNFLNQGKEIYVGNNFTGYNGSYYTGYRGLLDNVVLFTGLLDPSIELSLSKLFIKTGERIGTQTTIQTNYNLLSSGYLTTGYIGTGITGYELVQTQQIVNCTDNCLFYVKSGVTGLLTGEVIKYQLVQSESISYNETGINISDYDSGNANVFAKNYLILYKPIDNKDYVEVQSYELFDNLRNTTYSFGGDTYTSETDFSGYKNMVFFNGVDIGSGYYRMQDIKKFIIDSYTKDSKDNVYYKTNISNAKEFKFEYSGQEYLSNAFSGADYNVFLNGQKLIENYNFTHYPYNSAFVTGNLTNLSVTGYYYQSGQSDLWIGPTYIQTSPFPAQYRSFLYKDSTSGWRILSSAYGAPTFIGVPLYSGTASEYPWDSNFNTAYVGPTSVPPYPDIIQNPLNSRIYINNDTIFATGEIYIIEDKYLVNITGSNTGFFNLKPNYGSDMIWLNGILQKEFDDYILLSCNNDSMQSYGQKETKEGSIYNSESYRLDAI